MKEDFLNINQIYNKLYNRHKFYQSKTQHLLIEEGKPKMRNSVNWNILVTEGNKNKRLLVSSGERNSIKLILYK